MIYVNEKDLARLSIQKPVNLGTEEWIMIYQEPKSGRGRSHYNEANNVYNSLSEASRELGITVGEPYWIELDNEGDMKQIENELQHYINAQSGMRFPKIIVMILGQEYLYKDLKQVFKVYQTPSQVIRVFNAKKFNLSKASNILKQINSKMGGDLFHMKFPEKMNSLRTMLIGIDVCHSGGNSIVGFAASTNKEMSQYYSDFLVQKKGQEVVNSSMMDPLRKAIEVFAKNHKGNFPTDIIIFRDGVSAAERTQVVNAEVTQFQQCCNEMYNQAQTRPRITLVIVNKRIIQNFFVKDESNKLQNAPSGAIVDSELVEQAAGQGGQFDFFLFPVRGT